MKFTLSWLKQHLETTAPLETICWKLTSLGLEVEAVHDRGKALAPFIIAQVLTADKHPNADKLKVATVDTGKERLQVVCGAPNCRAGLKAVLARPGDVMPENGETLKKGTIRGVESAGMLCAADELGLGTEHAGIIELPADAPLGESFAKYAGLDDPVIEINLTPNRPDCAGVRGIARDLAASGLGQLKPFPIKPVPGKEASRIKVRLDFPDGDTKACPLFAGRLIRNIKNGPSPEWLQRRLMAIGLQPRSALVDITNYFAYDLARPLHVFDAKKIKGNIVVRPAKLTDVLVSLTQDAKRYKLEQGMTVIDDDGKYADDLAVLALGGVMGGAGSACHDGTTDVFIEAATFDPARTARTGRALQISSDARYRFERGVDPAFTVDGLELATRFVVELCGTPETIVSKTEIAGKVPDPAPAILLDAGKCLKHAGVDVPLAEQEKILIRLGFTVKRKGNALLAAPPSWRPDIANDADLVEEILRIKGYDAIPVTPLPRPEALPAAALDAVDQRGNAARRALAAQGLMEAVTWSFMPGKIAELFGPIDSGLRLANPISADLDVMRPSILGNLILAARRNADRGFADVGIFEVGPAYKNATPEGQRYVAAALRAGSTPRNWAEAARSIDVFDAKADALAALTAAGAPVSSLQITTDAPSYYHPGRSGVLRLGPNALASFGEIHPAVLAACDISGPVVGCEVCLLSLPQGRAGNARPLLKLEDLQPVTRDFAFVVGRDVSAAKLIKAVKDADKALIRDVAVFDVYEGDKVGADKKSIALSVTLQPGEKTLTDAEIEAVGKRITESAAQAAGATLRG